jgi:monothiol glutaredoxin
MNPIFATIEREITENPVVLFMKGSATEPLCGFSAMVVQILRKLEIPFKTVNVLADPELRDGIKAYTNWPTFPQLYISGEFIGGCDITREMYTTGELQKLLKDKGISA